MSKAIKTFTEELALHAKNPFIYDELTMRYVLREVLEIVETSTSIDEDASSFIAAVESTFHSLSSELDQLSVGFGSILAASVFLSDFFEKTFEQSEESRRFRCFKKHSEILKLVEAHPLYSHTELALKIGKTKGRLTQIVAELKDNRLLLVDRFGRENRYELTSLARHYLDEESLRGRRRITNSNASNNIAIGDEAERWLSNFDENNNEFENANNSSTSSSECEFLAQVCCSNAA